MFGGGAIVVAAAIVDDLLVSSGVADEIVAGGVHAAELGQQVGLDGGGAPAPGRSGNVGSDGRVNRSGPGREHHETE